MIRKFINHCMTIFNTKSTEFYETIQLKQYCAKGTMIETYRALIQTDSLLVEFVGEHEFNHLLPVLGHDEAERILVFLKRQLEVPVLRLELADLCVLLGKVHDERGPGSVASDLIQLVQVLLVLERRIRKWI